MRTNEEGIQLIKDHEGCRLTAYTDMAGILTIGWGHTERVIEGMSISQDTANEWLFKDISDVEDKLLELVTRVLNDNQLSALVSFCFNIGFGKKGIKSGFAELKNGMPSTLYRLVNQGDFDKAADEFPKWCQVAGKFTAGILARRLAEQELFLKPV